jgi:hypothetical protein
MLELLSNVIAQGNFITGDINLNSAQMLIGIPFVTQDRSNREFGTLSGKKRRRALFEFLGGLPSSPLWEIESSITEKSSEIKDSIRETNSFVSEFSRK